MSYNMKNKIVVMFATVFTFSVALANNVRAEDNPADITPPPASVEPMNNEQNNPNPAPVAVNDDPFGLDDPLGESAEADTAAPKEPEFGPRMPDMRDRNARRKNNSDFPKPDNAFPQADAMPEVNFDDVASAVGADGAGFADVTIDPSAPKSPFEKYGNAILSRVDNDLFNQMSEIEKQTTLLNLELKREEVKNRIDALKAQRERAKQEELNMEAEREKKARDEELQRQKALLQEQMKLKEKEMELEKIRQAKVLSEYMNETLITNQQWVETNGKLTAQVRNLQEERKKLLEEIEKKLEGVNQKVLVTMQNAEETHTAYERKVSALNKQIEGLKQVIIEKDNALQNATAEKDANPFATGEVIDESAVDMSKEYAIMDITGKGENIVAKIVSQDGTTFIVRKGSVLKGGETVTKITENYITFDNHGVKGYLYTGGTVLQYEPTEMFNDAPKTPNVATGVVNNQVIRNVRGIENNQKKPTNLKEEVERTVAPASQNSKSASATSTSSKSSSTASTAPRSNKGIASFSQGMMVK